MSATDYVIEVLGGPGVFEARKAPTSADVRKRIEQGLPYSSFESVRERLQMSTSEAARVLHMPLRTLARRKQARRLGADESDRLYRVARVAAQAVAVLGSEAKATAWLHRPNRALNGESPLRLLHSDIGAQQVEHVLGRIEHGIVG